MAEEKGLNRGGTGGQEGELSEEGRWREQPPQAQAERNQQKQPAGMSREPGLNPNSQRQEKHISD
jgi:hypothetical protein